MSRLSQQEQVLFDLLQDEKSKQIFLACKAYAEGETEGRNIFRDLSERPKGFESLVLRLMQNKYIIWGAGSVCKKLINIFSYFDVDKNCIEIWDGNPKLQNINISGIKVVAPKNQLNDVDSQRLYLIGLSEKMRKEQCAEIHTALVTLGVPIENILHPYWNVNNEWAYFDEEIVIKNLGQGEVFIDGGSYDFYTSSAFVKACDNAGATVKRVYAFEPNGKLGELCRKNAEYLGDKARVINAGLYSSDTKHYFEMHPSNTGDLVATERVTDIKLDVVALDNCIERGDKVSFIKYDVEGVELEALKGAANIIKRDMPNLAICIYHKPFDYIEIFQYIYSLVPEYKFYIRIYGAEGDDIVLHAQKENSTTERGMMMEKNFAEVIKNCLNGRKVVVWGTGPNSENLVGKVFKYCDIDFFLSRDAKDGDTFFGKPVLPPHPPEGGFLITSSSHFIVILAGDIYPEIREQLLQNGFRKHADFFDWWFFDEFDRIPFDRVIYGVAFGKYSYWYTFNPYKAIYIHSIGRFSSINISVGVARNHHMNMLTTSSACNGIFNKTEADLFTKLSDADIDRQQTITIGNDVWIGANVFINASTVATIGDGAIIGSGAVVTHDVPPYAVVFGVPAKVQRYRYSPEQIECLLRVKWWDWSDEQIRDNAELLMYPDKFFERFM